MEEITTEVLDQLLAELTNNGCENKLGIAAAKTCEIKAVAKEKSPAEPQSQGENNVSLLLNYSSDIIIIFLASTN